MGYATPSSPLRDEADCQIDDNDKKFDTCEAP